MVIAGNEKICIGSLKGVGTPNEIRHWRLNKVGAITALYYKHLSEILLFFYEKIKLPLYLYRFKKFEVFKQ